MLVEAWGCESIDPAPFPCSGLLSHPQWSDQTQGPWDLPLNTRGKGFLWGSCSGPQPHPTGAELWKGWEPGRDLWV